MLNRQATQKKDTQNLFEPVVVVVVVVGRWSLVVGRWSLVVVLF